MVGGTADILTHHFRGGRDIRREAAVIVPCHMALKGSDKMAALSRTWAEPQHG